jgi:hypothetical protein
MIDLKKVCIELEKHSCKTHNQHPNATISGKKIDISACCDTFQDELERYLDEEISKQIDKSIDDKLNDIL